MKIALLDMDGVLVDFALGALRLHGVDKSVEEIYQGHEGNWDLANILGLTPQQFWRGIDEDFWAGLEWMEDGKHILDEVERQFGRANVVIVTSPCANPGCHEGKLRWLRKHLPKHYSTNQGHMFNSLKHMLANPEHVLIDDHDANVDKFHNYKSLGAPYVHVPRPYNRRHPDRHRAAEIVARELQDRGTRSGM